MENTAAPANHRIIPLELPYDVIVHIVGVVAATSRHPFADLNSMGATCKAMHNATKEPEVLRCVALDKEKTMKLCNNDRFLLLLNKMTTAGNPEACFISSLMHVFTHQGRQTGLTLLQQAAAASHKTAAYMLGIILYSANDTRDMAKQYINQVEADSDALRGCETKMTNRECERIRWRAVLLMKCAKFAGAPKQMQAETYFSQCASEGCSLLSAKYYNIFCSNDCRIRYEYKLVSGLISYV